jgi:hypothetical protein
MEGMVSLTNFIFRLFGVAPVSEQKKIQGRHMNFDTINHICKLMREATSVRIRRGYFGSCSLKISYGPFGIVTKTFDVDHMTLSAVRNRVRLQRVVKRTMRPAQNIVHAAVQPPMALAA